ncbi:MAG: hypothetical protein GIW99_00835, partial [Candidatus Eremiobacteraeota bacterium]|nr:hypothetical protein [Candidatus Eremiobacteraeota bacterium]
YVHWLAELQPSIFCEVDPEVAVRKGIRNGHWCTITAPMGSIEARALVTGRLPPLRIGKGQRLHQIGVPYNYGWLGLATGDSAGVLVPLAMDPNVSIHEAKTLTCDIRRGRRDFCKEPVGGLCVPHEEQNPDGQPTVHGLDGEREM